MVNLNLIPKAKLDPISKCACVQAKQVRKTFSPITRTSEPLKLIHGDVCDSEFLLEVVEGTL